MAGELIPGTEGQLVPASTRAVGLQPAAPPIGVEPGPNPLLRSPLPLASSADSQRQFYRGEIPLLRLFSPPAASSSAVGSTGTQGSAGAQGAVGPQGPAGPGGSAQEGTESQRVSASFYPWRFLLGQEFWTTDLKQLWINQNSVGTVNTSGTAVTWVSGDAFNTNWGAAPRPSITINGVVYAISSVASGAAATLATSAGVQTGVSYSVAAGKWVNAVAMDAVLSQTITGSPVIDISGVRTVILSLSGNASPSLNNFNNGLYTLHVIDNGHTFTWPAVCSGTVAIGTGRNIQLFSSDGSTLYAVGSLTTL